MNLTKLNTNLPTLNFVLCFVGYAMATSVLLPVSSDIEGISRTVTIPYRAFALGVSLFVIIRNSKYPMRFTIASMWYLLFWGLLLFRMFYDLEIRSDLNILESDRSKLWLYAVFICFISLLSVLKSYEQIELKRAFRWIYFALCGIILLQLSINTSLTASASAILGRVDGGVALNTISFGHLATTTVILSIIYYVRNRQSKRKRLFAVVMACISLFVMLRAGSRGPLLSLFVVLFFYSFSKSSNRRLWLLVLLLLTSFLFMFSDFILESIRNISPIMYDRVELTIIEGNTGGREDIYQNAINIFFDNPIFGGQFCLVDNGLAGYSHNYFLDAFMGMGILGGLLFCYIICKCVMMSYKQISFQKGHEWIFLILIQCIVAGMTSGALYYDQLLTVLIGFVFINDFVERKEHKERTSEGFKL